MKNTEIGNNTEAYDDIVAARREIYKDINRIKSGEFSLEKGIVLHKLYTDLMEGYRIQTKVYEIATSTNHTPVTIEDTTKLLK